MRDSKSYGWGQQRMGAVGGGMGTMSIRTENGDTGGGGGDTRTATRDHKSCARGTRMLSWAHCHIIAV